MIAALMVLIGLSQTAVFAQNQELARRLSVADVRSRMDAVSELERKVASEPAMLADRTVQEAVVKLLEAENTRVAEHTASFLKTGEDRLSEAYAEYYAQILGLADRVRKDTQVSTPTLAARLRRALVLGVYNPDSEFAKDLAREGESIVPLVVELTRAPDGPSRWNAYALIGELCAKEETRSLVAPLSAASAKTLRAVARGGLVDPAPDVRRWAVIAVFKARDKEAIPMLERMAQNDPDIDGGPGKYSVRSLAAQALQRVR